MHQRQHQDTLSDFNQQVQNTLTAILKKHLPLEVSARTLDEEKFWLILLFASFRRQSIAATCQSLAAVPSGNRMREHLNEQFSRERMSVEQLEERLNRAIVAGLPKAVRRALSRREWEVAIDWTELPYYGQVGEPDQEFVRRSQAKDGTTKFYTFASITLTDNRHRYTLAVTLVKSGEAVIAVVKRLVEALRQLGIRVKLSLWDKAFGVIEVIRYLKKQKISYIIALAQRGGAGGIRQYCRGRKSGYARHRFKSAKSGEVSSEVVVVCKYSKKKYRRKGVRYFCYAVFGIGRMKPSRVFERYRRRFIIESSYRQMHQTRAKTTTKNVLARILLVAIALLIVNCYVLLRQIVRKPSSYGNREKHNALTLEMMIVGLEDHIKKCFGSA